MQSLSHRERVLAALDHKPTDRVPIDFGGMPTTDIVAPAYEKLKTCLDLNPGPGPDRTRPPEEPVLRRLDIDTRTVRLGGFSGDRQKVIDADTYVDEWGTTWKRASGNYYLDVDGAFKNSEPRIELLERFPWPDPDDPGIYRGIRQAAERLHGQSDYAIVQSLAGPGMFGILKHCCKMRGFSEFLTDLYQHPEFACRLLDISAEICIRIARNVLREVGENADIVYFPDDLGHQQSTFISPQMYREFVKPRHKRFFDAIRAESPARIVLHSDGAIFSVIEDLIDLGVDAINPVQITARNMEPERLRRAFGGRMAFWGGIDTRDVLPFGTPDQVRAEVRRIIDVLGAGGGLVLASVQVIQAEVPPENLVAMFDEARSYRASPA